MRLRARLQQELAARMAVFLPEAMATAWDHSAVVIAIEQLTFKPAGGIVEPWRSLSSFEGIMRAELRADTADGLPVEPLISDLVTAPLFISEDPATAIGALTESARAVLIEMRDTLRDQQVISGLRFKVTGLIVRREAPAAQPLAMIGAAPKIGPRHQDDYQQIGGDA